MSHTGRYATPETCVCGRPFTTRSGAKHHYAKCPIERARSAAFVAALESGGDPAAEGYAAAQTALAAQRQRED